MRVTNGMIRNNMLNSLYTNMNRLDTLYNQMNTLKKVQRPSDDPIITGRALKLKLNVLETQQHQHNVKEATSWMEVSQTALSNVTEIIKDIRTKCNQAANGTLKPEDRAKVLADIKQLSEQLKEEANVSYAGRYVFSGYKTDQSVFLVKDTKLTENVNVSKDMYVTSDTTFASGSTFTEDMVLPDGTILAAGTALTADTTFPEGTKIAKGSEIAAGTVLPKGMPNLSVVGHISGQDISYEIGAGNVIPVNVVGLDELIVDLVNDVTAMEKALNGVLPDGAKTEEEFFSNMLDVIDKRVSDLSEKVADLGSRQKRLEYTSTRLMNDKTSFTELLSNTEDVDIEEVYVEFNAQYAVYQSALQATSKSVVLTLADFLR